VGQSSSELRPRELSAEEENCNGTSEISMRNQFRAWREFMAP
jgi:hypothetical protein